MESKYEILDESESLGVRLILHKVSSFPLHWHSMDEFLFVLEGQAKITIAGETYLCKEGDLVLIHAITHHTVSAPQTAVLLALHVNPRFFGENRVYDINSAKYPNEDYSPIISAMAHLIKLHEEGGANHEILMQSVLLHFKYVLLTRYQSVLLAKDEASGRQFDKLQNVLRYIQENFRYDISLNEVAQKFFYSPSYLSRLFEKTLGVNFKRYVNNLRLSDATHALLTTDKPIDLIARESGFPNTRSFVALHKQVHGCLPSQRRKLGPQAASSPDLADNYLDFKKTDYLSKLAPYLHSEEISPRRENRASDLERTTVRVDSERPKQDLKHTFKTFCSVGRASDLLKENVREMLIEMQREIHFEYIKFHGIFDDDFSVYAIAPDGRKLINFDTVDAILDFLLSIGLKPLVQLSFMPRAMAKHPNKTTFYKPFVMSEPSSNAEWVLFVQRFISHLLSRYGQETVETWLFCLWNEPETDPRLFGFADPSLFRQFYIDTYKGVKTVCPALKFGTSSLMTETIVSGDYLERTFLSDPTAIPDFINIHFYPLSSVLFDEMNLASPSVSLSPNPRIMADTLDKVKEKLSHIGLGHLRIYLTEWNSTTSHRDLINDTAFKGAYVARNIIDNYDKIASFGYWSLTDDILELPMEDRLFHGGIGLFTKSGIKKPPYYAFSFLAQLGHRLLDRGRGYIVTEDIRGFQMVLVNYIHYSDIYAAGELFDASTNNRYAPFRNNKEIEMDVEISHAVTGDYQIEEYIVNREYGSCYDVWNERYGGEEPATKAAMDALKDASHPKYCLRRIHVEKGLLRYQTKLAPHEVRLVKIKRL